MKTYIDGKKFQFITDYSKHACKNTKGEDVILDFGKLTIAERIMLSSYLTILCDDKNPKIKKQNIYDKIFNFNCEKKYVKTSYHDSFLDDLTIFIKENPLFFYFIKDHFDEIEENKTSIYRSQLNSSEMEILYSLQFRRSYQSLMNVLYIIGVSKQNIQSSYLNKISLKNFYGSISMSKNRVKEIFEKINKISDNEVKYKIDEDYVYFSSGFEITQDEKFYSEEKKNFDKMKKEEEILNSFLQEDKKINKSPKIEKPIALDKEGKQVELPKEEDIEAENAIKIDQQIKQEKKINFTSIIDLSDEFAGRFSIEIFKNLQEYIDNFKPLLIQQWEEILTKNYSYDEKTKIYRYFSENYLNVNDEIAKYKELIKVLNNASLGENWKEIKDKAREQAFTIQNKICSKLNKLFDDENDKDHVKYKTAIIQCLKYYKNILFYNK